MSAAGTIAALRARGETVAVAESLTGGLLAATIVAVPGASKAFRGGLIVYATDLKASLAGVPAALLAAHGPVHADVAAALAGGARERCSADWGLATTGVAGPDPQDGIAVGTVFLGLAAPHGATSVRRLDLTGDRAAIRAAPSPLRSHFWTRRSAEGGSRSGSWRSRGRWRTTTGSGCATGRGCAPRIPEGRGAMCVVAPNGYRCGITGDARGCAMVLLRRVIGDAFRARRQAQHRTLREVSTAANVSLGYLSEIERGQKEASSELLAAICDALGARLSELLGEVSSTVATRRAGGRAPRAGDSGESTEHGVSRR